MSGGGTAGHIYPALTVAQHLVAEGHEVAFAGTPSGLEATMVPQAGIEFHALKASGFDRSKPLSLLTSALVIASSTLTAARLLGRLRPDVVIGFGGYVSLPVGMAAALRGVPLVCHEQNSVPGLANRVLSRWARAVGVTYESSIARLAHPERAVLTGNPVRPEVLDAARERGRKSLGLESDDVVLLVFGGSRGARHINDTLVALAPRLMEYPSLRVIHVAGRIEAGSVAERVDEALGEQHPRYRVVDYIERMGDAIAAADLVLARAGATSIAEITAIGRASVLVPYPYATDDHQTLNAKTVAEGGAAVVVADSDLDGEAFSRELLELTGDAVRCEEMAQAATMLARRDAAERVVAMAFDAIGGKEMR